MMAKRESDFCPSLFPPPITHSSHPLLIIFNWGRILSLLMLTHLSIIVIENQLVQQEEKEIMTDLKFIGKCVKLWLKVAGVCRLHSHNVFCTATYEEFGVEIHCRD
jgi:hypothetical protein